MNVVVNNTVLSNFALVHGENLVRKIFEGKLFTPEEVFQELKIGEDRNVVPKRDWLWIQVLRLETVQEQEVFRRLKQRFGIGESACLSLAVHRNQKLLTDDLHVRKYAQRCGIPISGTIGVLVLGITKSLLSLEEGNRLLDQMIEHGYYAPFVKLDGLVRR